MEDTADREIKICVTWRGKTLELTEKAGCTVGELGFKLKELTNVAPDTMRLLVPQSKHSGAVSLVPFSDNHGKLRLAETGISEGRTIRMMGVFSAEVEEVSRSAKSDLRIAGFLEEERRAKQRRANGPGIPRKLPQGPYVFCDFRTLQLPGIALNPPASNALAIMHRLASDPGIVAIMNKHRWCVGIMTEMAPEGYVGISPKCILGFNKNHGEEISLRLRTDDLKGFRKYESIKKTLLHELAHMVHSEHDAKFFALDKQLNEEAIALDWTKSRSRTLTGLRQTDDTDEFLSFDESYNVHKLGGNPLHGFVDARVSAAGAALHRFENSIVNGVDASMSMKQAYSEPDPDDSESNDFMMQKPDVDQKMWEEHDLDNSQNHVNIVRSETIVEPDPDNHHEGLNNDRYKTISEPDPDDCLESESMADPDSDDHLKSKNLAEPDPDDHLKRETMAEPDPDDCQESKTKAGPGPDNSKKNETMVEPDPDDSQKSETMAEPDPDDCQEGHVIGILEIVAEPDSDDRQENETMAEPDPDDCQESETIAEPDPDDSVKSTLNESSVIEMRHESIDSSPSRTDGSGIETIQWSLENEGADLKRIEESTAATCLRLQEAIQKLKNQVSPVEFSSVIRILFTILRNVMEHPNEAKFKRLRKANPIFQRSILKYEAAIEVLLAVGFSEDNISNELGMVEACLILKRNDPGLLWLARSSLETCSA